MQPTLTIDRQQLKTFENTIKRTILEGKKSVSGAMIQASVFASQSAAGSVYGQTKAGRFRSFGKKSRKSRRHKRVKQAKDERGQFVKGVSTMGQDGRPWWSIGSVDIWSKGKMKRQHFRTLATFKKAKAVPRRGLAGHVWRAAGAVKASDIAKLSMQGVKQGSSPRLIGAYSDNKTTKTDGHISRIQMSNSLDYISKVAPNSGREGVFFAERKLDGILRKGLARKIEKAFQQRQLK